MEKGDGLIGTRVKRRRLFVFFLAIASKSFYSTIVVLVVGSFVHDQGPPDELLELENG